MMITELGGRWITVDERDETLRACAVHGAVSSFTSATGEREDDR